jgi:hypothetical protein
MNTNEPPECIICYNTLNDTTGRVLTPCRHTYCTTCFILHMKIENRCAVCRQDVIKPDKPPSKKKIVVNPLRVPQHRGCFWWFHL